MTMKKNTEIVADMKNYSTFAMTSPKSFYKVHIVVAFFVAAFYAVIYKDKRLSNHNGLLHVCCNLTLASRGAIAFLTLNFIIFHYMPKSNENASTVNNSSCIGTSAHETCNQPSFTVSENTQSIYKCILSLRDHFNLTYNTIMAIHGSKCVDILMQDYVAKYYPLLDVMEKFLIDSINENFYNEKPNTL